MDKLKINAAKLVNWKPPGTDQVQNVWNRYLTSLYMKLARVYNLVAKDPSQAPRFMTGERTTPINKKSPTNVANKY